MEQRKLYISDLHLFHKNVTKSGKNFDNRPYQTIEEMNVDLLKRWNENVTNADHVYILGDLIWKFNSENQEEAMRLLRAMHGNLHLILGNHDRTNSAIFKSRFEEIIPYKRVDDVLHGQPKTVVLSHYYMPFYDRHFYGGILLHGHSHNSEESNMERKITEYLNTNGFPAQIYNVGCMYPYMDYAPKTLNQIVDGYNAWVSTNGNEVLRID